jgi:predicted  nucleic acid-binding Zn-ribbon protein
MNEAQNNREYQTLKEQIAADEQANSVLSDEVLEALEKIETQQKVVATADATLAKGREEAAKVAAQVTSERETFESELGRVSAELKALEETLPPSFQDDYKRAIHGRGEDGMAPLEGDACGGCYQNVTPQVFHHVASGKAAFCKNCGRLLYLPE